MHAPPLVRRGNCFPPLIWQGICHSRSVTAAWWESCVSSTSCPNPPCYQRASVNNVSEKCILLPQFHSQFTPQFTECTQHSQSTRTTRVSMTDDRETHRRPWRPDKYVLPRFTIARTEFSCTLCLSRNNHHRKGSLFLTEATLPAMISKRVFGVGDSPPHSW